ncbi:14991_t:CDS:2, partial [Cetraspora pellucida]
YDPIKFKQILEQNKPKLIEFFDELVKGLIPKKKKNKFANSYKLDIELHLASAGTLYKGIDILSNIGLTVLSKTVLRYKQQIVEDHFKKISKYFDKN